MNYQELIKPRNPIEKPKDKNNIEVLAKKMLTPMFAKKEVVESFHSLIENLGSNLSSYDTILSDDASGRLVSLVLKKIIDQSREKDNKEKTNIYFLAAGRYNNAEKKQAVKNFIELNKTKMENVLIVTEHIGTGATIEDIMKVLEELNINFNVAALSTEYTLKHYSKKLQKKLFYGENGGRAGMEFYQEPASKYSGVEKNIADNSPHPESVSYRHQQFKKDARHDVAVLAEALEER